MQSSGMLRHVILVRTDVSEERSASIIRVTRIGELGITAVINNQRKLRNIVLLFLFLRSVRQMLVTANVIPSLLILVTLMMKALRSSET
jgi:hypothetical protein